MLCMLACGMTIKAQVVYSEPPVIQQSSTGIVIYFNADEGNTGLIRVTSGVYAHTGVITSESESSSDWKHAPTWLDNSDKYAMTYVSTDLWKLEIGDLKTYYELNEGETVTSIAFVFRDAAGNKQGKTAAGGDIFLDVYPDGLALNLTSSASSSVLTDDNCKVSFTVNTTQLSDISLHLNDANAAPFASVADAVTLTSSYTFPVGDYDVIAKAVSGNSMMLDTLQFCHRGESAQANYGGTLKPGANKNADGSVTFSLTAPGKKNVILVGEWDGYRIKNENLMNYQGNRDFWITIPAGKIDMDKEYGYYFIVDDNLNVADPYSKLILDPWNDKYINQGYTRYPDLKQFPSDKVGEFIISVFHGNGDGYEWEVTDFEAPAKENLIIYELLFRDFTEEQCIESAMEKLDYLETLGINAIELMPVQEFDGNNSWGYNPNFYFAPDKYYGSSTMYKKFIDECHKRGIAVILDVVFNHTWGMHPWCMMYWDSAAGRPSEDNPFYNAVAPHNFSVGNEWKMENATVQQYMCDVLKYWLEEYKVDGYRFDLAKGLGDTDSYANDYDGSAYNTSRTVNIGRFIDAVYSVNPDAYAILEYFVDKQEENYMANNYGAMSWKNMNNAYCQSAMGYPQDSDFGSMYTGNESRPFGSTVGYMESHDEERMGYKQTAYGSSTQIKRVMAVRMRRLGSNAAFSMLVPGAKMIWQFGELGYDISGGQGDTSMKEPHWEYLDDANRKGLYDCYSELLAIRKANPDLFASDAEFYWNVAVANWEDGRFMTMRNHDRTKELVAAYNPTSEEKTFSYTFDNPGGVYYLSSHSYGVEPTFDAGASTITVPAHSYAVITNLADATGVNDIVADKVEDAKVSIFPNPASNFIQVNSNDVARLEVYNLAGQLLNVVEGVNMMDVSSLPQGHYIVKIFTSQGVQVQKLMKK